MARFFLQRRLVFGRTVNCVNIIGRAQSRPEVSLGASTQAPGGHKLRMLGGSTQVPTRGECRSRGWSSKWSWCTSQVFEMLSLCSVLCLRRAGRQHMGGREEEGEEGTGKRGEEREKRGGDGGWKGTEKM